MRKDTIIFRFRLLQCEINYYFVFENKIALELFAYPILFLYLCSQITHVPPQTTPPNALVMQAVGYTFGDYVKVGLPLQIIMGIVMTIVLPLLFPL